jgi:hypothetical protein
MSEVIKLGHSTFIARQLNESTLSPRSSTNLPLGPSVSEVRSLVQDGHMSTSSSGATNLSSNLGRLGGKLRSMVDSQEGEGEEETQDARPIVIRPISTANEGDLVHHQLLLARIKNSHGVDDDKQIDVWNIAQFNQNQRSNYDAYLKEKKKSEDQSKEFEMFGDLEVAAACDDKEHGVETMDRCDVDVHESVMRELARQQKKDEAVKDKADEMKDIRMKIQNRRDNMVNIDKYIDESIRSTLFLSLIFRQWRRLGVLETLMPVKKLSNVMTSSTVRDNYSMRSVLGVFFSGPIEVRDIWPFEKDNHSHLYLLYMAYRHSADEVHSGVISGPIVIWPWATNGPMDKVDTNWDRFNVYKDVMGHYVPVACEYIGTVLDLKGHPAPPVSRVMDALGLTTHDLPAANAAHDKLMTIKINLRR